MFDVYCSDCKRATGDRVGVRSLCRRHRVLRVRPGPGVALDRRDVGVADLRQRVRRQRPRPCRQPHQPSPHRRGPLYGYFEAQRRYF